MKDSYKEFLEIFEDIQELCRLTDAEVKASLEVTNHLRLMANMIYFYRKDGAKKVDAAVREKFLKEMGVAVLKPKGKS
jgi:hypothetical protein